MRIVASAVHLFGTRDYDAVTVADVCTGARVSKRYFYEHFVDREDLIGAVHRELNDWVQQGMASAMADASATLTDSLRRALRVHIGQLRDHPDRARLIYINAPRSAIRRRALSRRNAEFFGHFVRRAGAQGDDRLRDDRLRYDRTLLALVAGVSEVIVDWIIREMSDDPDELAEHLAGIAAALLAEQP
ncbi:MAG TPA: TetR/AcrR family transcriptional regulator [Actinoplanes sp.]